MTAFETKRLRVQSLTPHDYLTFESGVEPQWDGFTNPFKHLIEGPHPLPHRIPRVKAEPLFAEIGILLAIAKETQEIVGSAGFHDFPDHRGMIEIGYSIVPEFQNKGLGTELLLGMWDMICTRSDVQFLRYTVSPNNDPSLHIINKLNFHLVGEQMDPEDGRELIYEKTRTEYLLER